MSFRNLGSAWEMRAVSRVTELVEVGVCTSQYDWLCPGMVL